MRHRLSSVERMSQRQLNTPTKRIGVLVLIAGALMVALGLMQFSSAYSADYAFRRGLFWALRNAGNDGNATGGLLLWLGLLMIVGGLLTSFLYELTVGKVAHWVRTGSLPQPTAPRAAAPPRPSKPPPAWVQRIGDVLLALIQNWATALFGFVMGVVYQQMGKPEYVLAPAGIAFLFWLRAAIGTAVSGDDRDYAFALTMLLIIKLVVAYLFFGAGLLFAATGMIR